MKNLITSLSALLFTCLASQAAILVTNPITDTNPSASNPYTAGQSSDFPLTLTASGIGRGAGIAASSATNRYSASGFNSASVDLSDYFTFTLTPSAGNVVNFTNFVYTGQASGTGPTSFAFRSNVDGFLTNIGSPTASGTTIDLSAAAYENRTTDTEFRLYGFGASSGAGTFSVNDFTFNGDVVPVPEPSVALLGALGALALLLRRRA